MHFTGNDLLLYVNTKYVLTAVLVYQVRIKCDNSNAVSTVYELKVNLFAAKYIQ